MEEFTQKHTTPDDTILDNKAKMTVRPIHQEAQVQGEQSSSEIANVRANGPAIGNFEGDIDTTESVIVKTANQRAAELIEKHNPTPPTKSSRLPVFIITASVIIGMLLFFLLNR